MQDGKALQAGTSHFLGQNFAKAFDVKFATKEGTEEYVWGTSWGVSTRLMGALIMAHSDDDGLVLPPNLAPIQVVIVPIFRKEEDLEAISEAVDPLIKSLRAKNIDIKFDKRDTHKPGWKFAEYELKGVPVRIAVGPKDLEKGTFEIARRDTKEKSIIQQSEAVEYITNLLEEIQINIYSKALSYKEQMTSSVDTWAEFKSQIKGEGGFVYAHWDGTSETEEKIKNQTKATIRCIPLDAEPEAGKCIFTGNPSTQRVLFAKAY
jgi:prolyl-tRNA synthetase